MYQFDKDDKGYLFTVSTTFNLIYNFVFEFIIDASSKNKTFPEMHQGNPRVRYFGWLHSVLAFRCIGSDEIASSIQPEW